MTIGRVHSIESFGSVDGPGIRYIIFLQGCHMRCRYCHNVDTWDMDDVKNYHEEEASALLDQAERYRSYWGEDGGITVSGGDPLLQIDFLIELFRQAKERKIGTCIDTSLNPFRREEPFFSKFRDLMSDTDLLLVDIKHIDPARHKWLTGQDNANILDGICYLDSIHKPIWIRQVLVPGITDQDADLYRTRDFIASLSNVEKVEVLPYHSLGLYKWEELGMKNSLADVEPPTREQTERAQKILRGEPVD